MKRTGIIIIIIIGIILLGSWSIYNGLVKKQEAMASAWSQVENVYQRRADLVPSLVAVVKNYAEYEQETLASVTEARARATTSAVDMENFDETSFSHFESAQKELGNSLNRLLVSIENYPDLKASDNYQSLQVQLTGCENRIQTERQRYNEATKAYNQSIRKFPNILIANLFGFENRPYFEADERAEKVPETY